MFGIFDDAMDKLGDMAEGAMDLAESVGEKTMALVEDAMDVAEKVGEKTMDMTGAAVDAAGDAIEGGRKAHNEGM